ncbi:MAG TPA: glutamate--tRNA ligase [Candidatus Nitrosopolaris sp.]|nr:glutamate--tRNA ligase [Candidatus Nitrosopolaris sp.]
MTSSSSCSVDEGTRNTIKIIALKNAIQFGGKARDEAVISKIIAHRPDLRSNLKNLIPEIKITLEEINALTLDQQKSMFARVAPQESAIKKKVMSDHDANLPALHDATMGSVVTRFPPEPNGYPHIGHAKAAIIDDEYARRYNGKLILRFDDTNPLNEKAEYYDAIRKGIEWLGIEPDIVKNTSDDIQLLSDYGKKLVELGGAYVCRCTQPVMRDLRSKGLACDCRKDAMNSRDLVTKLFDGSLEPNTAVLRFKGDMADQNTAMRDPTLFRIIEGQHPRLGNSNRVWPTYDFAAPVEDSLDGVTHALRTKEYELRNALYFAILERLSLRKPLMLEFSRLEFEGMPVSKRKIKPLVENGLVQGWDDPRLPTLEAIKRRGFLPQAIRKFVLSLGLTLSETKPPFEALEAFNRKIIDPETIRLFFVKDPVQVQVRNGNPKEVTLNNHPSMNLGHRKIRVSNSFYIAGDDAARLRIGDEIRLMELYNIRIAEIKSKNIAQHRGLNNSISISSGSTGSSSNSSGNNSGLMHVSDSNNSGKLIVVDQTGDEIYQDMPKIQWVTANNAVQYRVLVARELYIGENYNTNSLETCEGFAESFISSLNAGTHVQLVRFGFCRINGGNTAIFTHR